MKFKVPQSPFIFIMKPHIQGTHTSVKKIKKLWLVVLHISKKWEMGNPPLNLSTISLELAADHPVKALSSSLQARKH